MIAWMGCQEFIGDREGEPGAGREVPDGLDLPESADSIADRCTQTGLVVRPIRARMSGPLAVRAISSIGCKPSTVWF